MKHQLPPEASDDLPEGHVAIPQRAQAPRRSRRRIVLILLLVLALVLAAAGFGYYRHLNSNLTSVEMPVEVQGEKPLEGLPKGTAQNILVIGTDSRQKAADCKLGGSCGEDKKDGETNADVELLVHISADQTWMTIVSLPRDTLVDLPACSGNGKTREATTGRINGSLNYGIECQLRTVHQLTGLPISHFMMVDFSGVVSLSDAVGGVDVCVDKDVYDTYSHLKLAQGKHTLQGVAALQFVRTRHGFGDGGDLGRTIGQRLYLSSLQRKLESAGTLLNPQKVYRLAEAGTKALTVDKGLADVSTLAKVATTVGNIPSSATTFVTMPSEQNPENENTVLPTQASKELFAKLAADQPLVTPRPKTSAHPSSTASASSSAGGAATSASAAPAPATTPGDATGDSASPTPDQAAGGSAQVSSETTGCAQVSTFETVEINGEPMTPTEAYARSPRIPNSAP
ncbi:LCP family protein [Luteococcus sp. H138]|uniref:LCP family protein n=1 Tax=unclassified Luteococcus TaxID=2639923 RepID=UPI00313D5107